jgi:uncharacterized protein YegJ (DUF2314 family)
MPALGVPIAAMSESDEEPLFVAMSDDDETLVTAVAKAKKTLPHFKRAFSESQYKGAYFLVKASFLNRDETGEDALALKVSMVGQYHPTQASHIWLAVNDILEDLLFCTTFEVSNGFIGLKNGASYVLEDEDINDRIINDDGKVYGGFSMRGLRNAIAEKNRERFDAHTGISEYSEDMP